MSNRLSNISKNVIEITSNKKGLRNCLRTLRNNTYSHTAPTPGQY